MDLVKPLLIVVLSTLQIQSGLASEETKLGYSCQDNWKLYKDLKCFKVFEEFTKNGPINYTEAFSLCTSVDAQLPTIWDSTEQEFISNFVFEESQIFDYIWLGAKQGDGFDFTWNDGQLLLYTNWMDGSPKNVSGHCIQMEGEHGSPDFGKWRDVECQRRNLVVCQKRPIWNWEYLQEIIMEQRQKLEHHESNPVPLGFVYTQYPMDPSPGELWPSVQWTDVTSVYAGAFFRAVGAESGEFGEIQKENSPRIDKIQHSTCERSEPTCTAALEAADVDQGIVGWSSPVTSGAFTSGSWTVRQLLSIHSNGGEVRPQNYAIKIFKRTA